MTAISRHGKEIHSGIALRWALLERALVISAALSTAFVFLVRGKSVAENYGWAITSGLEASAQYGTYRACAYELLYRDFHQDTVGFVFNFLFYEFYGAIVRLVGDCGRDTPLIAHYVTTGILLLGVCLYAAYFVHRGGRPSALLLCMPFSPLVGWWAYAVRPDIAAAVLTALSVDLVFANLERDRVLSAILAALALCLAWSFKQTSILIAPYICMFLALNTIRTAILFSALVCVYIVVVVLFFGGDYVQHTIIISSEHPYFLSLGEHNFSSFVVKSSPLLVIFLVSAYSVCKPKSDRATVFYLGAVSYSLVVFAAAAMKLGASDSYFLPVLAILCVATARWWRFANSTLQSVGTIVSAALLLVLNVAVCAGLQGTLTLNDSLREAALQTRKMAPGLQGPKLVWDEVLALPWIAGEADTHVFDELIDVQSSPARSFDVGKKIADGFYETILIDSDSAYVIDPTRALEFRRYSKCGRIGRLAILIRIPDRCEINDK